MYQAGVDSDPAGIIRIMLSAWQQISVFSALRALKICQKRQLRLRCHLLL